MGFIKKSYKIFVIILLIIIISSGFLLPLLLIKGTNIENIDIQLKFEGDNAYIHVEEQILINQTHFRIPGTQGREQCAQYFITKFQQITTNFSYVLHNFTVHSIECQNVLFKLNENFSNIVILGAHYDSRARATKDPIIANRTKPVPGANDGASGCAVLIELARVLYERRINLSCQFWFLFFDAEDQGYDYTAGIEDWDWCKDYPFVTSPAVHEWIFPRRKPCAGDNRGENQTGRRSWNQSRPSAFAHPGKKRPWRYPRQTSLR